MASTLRDGALSHIIAAAEERSGFAEFSGGVPPQAVLDTQSAQEHIEWNVANAMPKREDEDVDGDEVIMMDEDNDTEFEQDQEDGPVVDMDDIPDGPDDPEGMQFLNVDIILTALLINKLSFN